MSTATAPAPGRELNACRGGGFLPIGPFRAWIIEHDAEYGKDATYSLISVATDCTYEVAKRKRYRWLNESEHIPLDVVDRMTLAADGPDLLRDLYPVDGLTPNPAQPSQRGEA